MIQRRKFVAAVMSCVGLTSMMGVVGLVGGCGDSSLESPAPSPEAVAKEKEAQKGMLEYLAKKKAGAGAQKKP